MERKVLFFDVETNGFQGSSVLSFSAYVVRFVLEGDKVRYKVLEKIDRYYYPKEKYNMGAINVNGLSEDVITDRRGESNYSMFFKEDDFINELCNNVDLFVAHNIKFDSSFLPVVLEDNVKLCTMTETVNSCKLPFKTVYRKKNNSKDRYKNPKLMEMAAHFQVAIDEEQLHNSLYDVEVMFQSFLKIACHIDHKDNIRKFLFNM